MDSIITCFWVFLEMFGVSLFCRSLLPAKKQYQHWPIYFIGWLILLAFIFNPFFTIPSVVWSIVVNLCISFYVYRGGILQTITVVILSSFILAAIDTIFAYGGSAFLHLTLEEFYERKRLYVAVVTGGKLFYLFAAWVLYRYRSNLEDPVYKGRWLVLFLVFPLFSFLVLAIIFQTFQESADLSIGAFLFSLALLIANVAILLLISAIEKATMNAQNTALLNQQMDIQEKSIRALEESYRAQRESAHEFQHLMQTIANLIDLGQYDALKNYVGEITKGHSIRVLSVNSHHSVIDAVLNQKYQYAKERDIDFQVRINDLSAIALPSNMLVVLLSNLLDNAIEACERCTGNRQIKCSLIHDLSFYIAIENTSNPIDIVDGKITSIKVDKINHGYGLPNILKILQMLNAEYTFFYSDGFFHFVTEIPL